MLNKHDSFLVVSAHICCLLLLIQEHFHHSGLSQHHLTIAAAASNHQIRGNRLIWWFCLNDYYRRTCTSHTAQFWRPAPPGRCLCSPKRESPPSAWPAHPAGPAAFGRWTGSPHAAHTGPQAVADCHLPSGSMRMYRHIPRRHSDEQGHVGAKRKYKRTHYRAVMVGETRNAHGRRVMNY